MALTSWVGRKTWLQEDDGGKLFYPLRLPQHIVEMLTAPRLSTETYLHWRDNANMSRDFWIETKDSFFRIHMTPRRGFFTPHGWNTGYGKHFLGGWGPGGKRRAYHVLATATHWSLSMIGQRNWKIVVLIFGFAEAASSDQIRAPLRMPSAWEMRKGELMDELTRRNIPFSASWTVPELRSLLVENVKKDKKGQMHFTGMTLEELRTRCNDMEINYPAKASKGDLMRLLRSNANPNSDEEITFGRYKGLGVKLRELPENYMEWIKAELKANPSPHPELARVGRWLQGRQTCGESSTSSADPEKNAVVPVPKSLPVPKAKNGVAAVGSPQKTTSTPRTGKTRRSQESSERSSPRRTRGQEASEAEAVLDPGRGDDQAEADIARVTFQWGDDAEIVRNLPAKKGEAVQEEEGRRLGQQGSAGSGRECGSNGYSGDERGEEDPYRPHGRLQRPH